MKNKFVILIFIFLNACQSNWTSVSGNNSNLSNDKRYCSASAHLPEIEHLHYSSWMSSIFEGLLSFLVLLLSLLAFVIGGFACVFLVAMETLDEKPTGYH